MINPLEFMKNLEGLKSQAEDLKNKAASLRATGYAMGNMIEAVVSGEMKVLSLRIDPSLLKDENREMLEVLVASAVNNALENLKQLMAQQYSQIGQSFGIM